MRRLPEYGLVPCALHLRLDASLQGLTKRPWLYAAASASARLARLFSGGRIITVVGMRIYPELQYVAQVIAEYRWRQLCQQASINDHTRHQSGHHGVPCRLRLSDAVTIAFRARIRPSSMDEDGSDIRNLCWSRFTTVLIRAVLAAYLVSPGPAGSIADSNFNEEGQC